MQDKIIISIAAYLEGTCRDASNEKTIFLNFGSLNPGHYTFEGFCQEIAEEIAAAIAPLVEAGEPDDSQYTDDFLKWREKYFDRKTQVKHFRSKHNGEFRDVKQLERQYERAYNCNSKKSK